MAFEVDKIYLGFEDNVSLPKIMERNYDVFSLPQLWLRN